MTYLQASSLLPSYIDINSLIHPLGVYKSQLRPCSFTQIYESACMCVAKSLQSCLTLCDPMDCSPLGSSVHGILQARILECVAMPSSRGPSTQASNPHLLCFLNWRVGSSPLAPPGKPTEQCRFYQRFHKRNGKGNLQLISRGKLPCFLQ